MATTQVTPFPGAGPARQHFDRLAAEERGLRDLLDTFPNDLLYNPAAVVESDTLRDLTAASGAIALANALLERARNRHAVKRGGAA